ncbi:hypothetical protein PQX77_002030 [Marasmius sp. AFHP31]|nr:hypothetical protein PQX77_002030 [Marasmius sp. AFHP31]
MNNLLTNATDFRIGDYATIQSVGRDATTNIYNISRGDLVSLNGNVFRRFPMGDIIVRRDVSSEVLEVTIEPQRQESSGAPQSQSRVMKVRKTTQHAEILGLPGGFTSITLEPIGDHQEDFKMVSTLFKGALSGVHLPQVAERIWTEMASRRSSLLTQLAGLGWSERLMLIVHDELVNWNEIQAQLLGAERHWIAQYYFWYTLAVSRDALDTDQTLTFPVLEHLEFWTFNQRTHTWQYDIPSVTLSPRSNSIPLETLELVYRVVPLRRAACPRLNPDDIVAFFEEQFGDFLHVIASSGHTRHVKTLAEFARHGILTFGAVFECGETRILAHFPSLPRPEWHCGSFNRDVAASYSTSNSYRVDLSFKKTKDIQGALHFSLRLPDPFRYRVSYLSQSLPFCDGSTDPEDLMFVDCVGFALVGTFHRKPGASHTPVYLFVPPIPVELFNGVYCLCLPLPRTLFYWSLDLNGRDVICKEDWHLYGIPTLRIILGIGSSWLEVHYDNVQNYIQKEDPNADGEQYAQNHGYPKLIHSDPHRTEDRDPLEDLGTFIKASENEDFNQGQHNSDEVDTPGSSELSLRNQAQRNQGVELENGTALRNITQSSTRNRDEGPNVCITRDSGIASTHSLAWPRIIFELLLVILSIAVVVFSFAFS